MKVSLLIVSMCNDSQESAHLEVVGIYLDPFVATEKLSTLINELSTGEFLEFKSFKDRIDDVLNCYIDVMVINTDDSKPISPFNHEHNSILYELFDSENKNKSIQKDLNYFKGVVESSIPKLEKQIEDQSKMITELYNSKIELLNRYVFNNNLKLNKNET